MLPQFQDVLKREMNKFVSTNQMTPEMGVFIAGIEAALVILASQIDLLRNELIAKGIEVSN